MRAGSSIGCTKPIEATSSRNLVTNENHTSVLEPTSNHAKEFEGIRNNYNRVFGRDISNIVETRSFADQHPLSQANK